MLVKKYNLNENIWNKKDLESIPTRNGFGKGLLEAGKKDPRIVAVCADLAESTRSHWFREEFPDRYIEVGVAEQNLATVGSGLAAAGKIPFIMSYATFSPGRNNEQIRTTISLNDVPVKVVGCHAGISVGPDGATHQALEDIALMRAQPNMTVVNPADFHQAKKATEALAKTNKPAYLRLARAATPVLTTEKTPFAIGKAYIYYQSDSPDVTIISTGTLLHNALQAAKELEEKNLGSIVVNVPTIKPLDVDTILTAVEKTNAVVTVEEHQMYGGFGSAIAELLATTLPTPIEFIAVKDRFGQSGTPEELWKEYSLDKNAIKKAVKKVLKRASAQ